MPAHAKSHFPFRIRLFPAGRVYLLPVPRLPQFVLVVYRKEHRFRTSMRTGASSEYNRQPRRRRRNFWQRPVSL
jgi:hypothetical protein